MEARLLRTVWGLFLVYLLRAESTRVDLVPEKVPLSLSMEALLGLDGKLEREGRECLATGSLFPFHPTPS